MRATGLVLIFALLAGSALAWAPHPSILTVEYEKRMLPVAKVIGTRPVVVVDGKEKRIRKDSVYSLGRAEEFSAEKRVAVLSVNLDLTKFAVPANDEGNGTSYFEAKVRSDNTIRGGYATVVVFFTDLSSSSGEVTVHSQVIVHDIPDLIAGKDTVIKFSAALTGMRRDLQYFFQLFDSSGREILTSETASGWKYFALRDRQQLRAATKKYVTEFAGQDHPAKLVSKARPVFPEGVAMPTGEMEALLRVNAEGIVEQAQVTGAKDLVAGKCIADALAGWLFLPRLADGIPVACEVSVPVKF